MDKRLVKILDISGFFFFLGGLLFVALGVKDAPEWVQSIAAGLGMIAVASIIWTYTEKKG